MNESCLVGFESTSNCFDLIPDFDKNLRILGLGNPDNSGVIVL